MPNMLKSFLQHLKKKTLSAFTASTVIHVPVTLEAKTPPFYSKPVCAKHSAPKATEQVVESQRGTASNEQLDTTFGTQPTGTTRSTESSTASSPFPVESDKPTSCSTTSTTPDASSTYVSASKPASPSTVKVSAKEAPKPPAGSRVTDQQASSTTVSSSTAAAAAMTSRMPCITLRNGVKMPALGLGVWQIPNGAPTAAAVSSALRAGYRLIDAAAMYGNESGVGEGIKASGVPREEVFVVTKIWNNNQSYDKAIQSAKDSMARLGTDYVDLLLIHWPGGKKTIGTKGKAYLETWKALEELHEQKKASAIGFCNFLPHHMDDIFAHCKIQPMVNQIEVHPYCNQGDVRAYCRAKDVAVMGWSPLGHGGAVLKDPKVVAIAQKYGKSPAQVVLRWAYQNGVVAIPKAASESHMIENAAIFDFELTDTEMSRILGMNRNERTGPHPDEFDMNF